MLLETSELFVVSFQTHSSNLIFRRVVLCCIQTLRRICCLLRLILRHELNENHLDKTQNN